MPTEPTKVPEPQPPAMLNWSLACSSSGQLMSTSSLDTGLMSGMIFSWSKCPMPASWRIEMPTLLIENCLPSKIFISMSIESAPMMISAGSICDIR